jgi:hypothetical protein
VVGQDAPVRLEERDGLALDDAGDALGDQRQRVFDRHQPVPGRETIVRELGHRSGRYHWTGKPRQRVG